MKIKVSDIDNHRISLLEFIKEKVEENFKVECLIERKILSLDFAYVEERNQYFSTPILNYLSKLDNSDIEKVIWITEKDLFVPSLNFIFGQAQMGGRNGIISTFRLKTVEENLYYMRCAKEVNHELGHTFGLSHCKNEKCVMFFSNSLSDTDGKNFTFCNRCQSIYERIISE